MRLAALVLIAAGSVACVPGPDRALERWAAALEADDLEAAYALTAESYRAEVPPEAFAERFESAESRLEAGAAARDAAATVVVTAAPAGADGPLLVRSERGWRLLAVPGAESAAPLPGEPAQPGAPEEVLRVVSEFLAATDAGDFAAAWRLLAGPVRARYTPERLAEDFAGAEGAAREALSRARAALGGEAPEVVVEADRAWLPLGGGLAVRLVRETDGWRIAELQ